MMQTESKTPSADDANKAPQQDAGDGRSLLPPAPGYASPSELSHAPNRECFGVGGVLYRTIVADPPWPIAARMGAGGRRKRATVVPYSFMSIAEIMALRVADIADEQAHLYLWTTRRYFREGIACEVARAWGFEPCGELIWGLRNGGMGGFLGNGHEPILLATRGGLPWPKNELPAGVHFWKQPYARGKIHSAKPDGFQDLVERVSPAPRVELFARAQRLGWHTWGNQSFCHTSLGGGGAEPLKMSPADARHSVESSDRAGGAS